MASRTFSPRRRAIRGGRPAPTGVSKLCGDKYLAHYGLVHGLSTLALRYANVYGPGQDPHGEAGVVAIFLNKLLAGETATINGDGLQTRDYVYVGDVARANVLGVESAVTGALNVGTGVETTVVDLAQRLAKHAGVPPRFANGPAKPGEQHRSSVDPAAAGKALGWSRGRRWTRAWRRPRARSANGTEELRRRRATAARRRERRRADPVQPDGSSLRT